jgi:hypothetical protein
MPQCFQLSASGGKSHDAAYNLTRVMNRMGAQPLLAAMRL